MSNSYNAHFYIKNNILRCVISDGNKVVNLREKAAVELLKEADKADYNLRVRNGRILLLGTKDKLNVELDRNIFTSDYKFCARKTYKKLKRLNKEYMKDRYKGTEVKKTLVRGSLIAAGPLAAVFLSVSLAKPNKVATVEKEAIPIETVQEETDNIVYIQAKTVQNPDYLSNLDEFFEDAVENEIDLNEEDYLVEELEPTETYYSNIDLDVEDRSQEDDVIAIRDKYHDEALRAQNRWGIDARILLAMLTQETHDNDTNLMQIEFNAYKNHPIKVYNFQEDRYMTVVFTNDAAYFSNADMTISEEELLNPITQMGAAAIIMNYNNLNDYNAIINPAAMIDQYNKGLTKFTEVLDYTPGSREEILGNPNNIDFLAFDRACGVGDPDYVLNTMQYVDQSEGPLMVYTFNKDTEGNKYPVRVQFSINKTLSNSRSL